MSNEELARARAELKNAGADWALLSSGDNVTYISHYPVPVDFGALATLTFAPPLAFVGVGDSASSLLVGSMYENGAKQQSVLDEVVSYETGLAYYRFSARDNFLKLLRDTLHKAGLSSGKARFAIEEKTLPTIALRLLQTEFPNIELIEAGAALTNARLIKTERELDLLRFAAQVNQAGHEELRRQTREAGKNDFAMWATVMEAMERTAGQMLYVFGELVTGARTTYIAPGGPIGSITRPGDLALMDMSPRVNGYWSDTTNTMVIGGVEPTAKQKRYGIAAREAFQAAAETMRPGRQARDAFEAAKQTFEKYGLEIGHYAGHQIGTTVNEVPRLMPYEDMAIQAGMVFSIETGTYEGPQGDTGARMEKSVIVHDSGPEIICDFEWGF
jgi:Xaa-Pro aminopeptidase